MKQTLLINMIEVACEIKGKSQANGSNTTIALKTYLDENNDLVYRVLVVSDFVLIEESEEFKHKYDAVMYFDILQKMYRMKEN